jgi:hypothetical protein
MRPVRGRRVVQRYLPFPPPEQQSLRVFAVVGIVVVMLTFALIGYAFLYNGGNLPSPHAVPFSDATATNTVQKYYQAQAAAMIITPGTGKIAKWCYQNPINHLGVNAHTENELWCGVSVTQTITTLPNTMAIDGVINGLQATAESEGLSTWFYNATTDYPDQFIQYHSRDAYDQTSGGYGCSASAVSDYMPYNAQGDYYLEFVGAPSSQDYAPNKVPAHLRYEIQCDGASARIPVGYMQLK